MFMLQAIIHFNGSTFEDAATALQASGCLTVTYELASGPNALLTENLPSSIEDLRVDQVSSTITCVIRACTGMRQSLRNVRLWSVIVRHNSGFSSLDSYCKAMVFAAGVGNR